MSTLILNIMTNKPMVTMMSKAKLNHPITMALVPTPDLTLPLPKSCAMMEAATDAVCCHSTDTRTKTEAMKMMARAICDTGRLGKGLISRSEPSLSSSSCQPGKVASSRKQTKANMMAMMSRYGNTIMSLNWPASQMRFNGSWSTDRSLASAVALLLHNQEPPSVLIHIPK